LYIFNLSKKLTLEIVKGTFFYIFWILIIIQNYSKLWNL
jgi:hypothetical protein